MKTHNILLFYNQKNTLDELEPTLILNQNVVKSVKSGRNYELVLAGFPVEMPML